MAAKDKLLADAQKLQQKGQLDKAIACFREALALDQGDIRLRQRLAELLAKCRRTEEARKEFEIIGRNLTANGFYLKAIAVYKQVERLCPDDISIALILASLNEQHGLPANALEEYKRAFDHYTSLNQHVEALKALEAMQRIDARNPNILLKYAEVLYQQGRTDDAFEAFRRLGQLLVDRRDDVAFGRLSARIPTMFPAKPDFLEAVLEQRIAGGGAEQAAALLQGLVKADPQRLSVWQLLVRAYQSLENRQRLKTVCQHFSRFFPLEPLPRQVLIETLIEDGETDAALSALDDAEPVLVAGGAADALRDFYLRLDELQPINIRVLKGCVRACEAAGRPDEAASFVAKIASLANLVNGSAGRPDAVSSPEEETGPVEAEPEVKTVEQAVEPAPLTAMQVESSAGSDLPLPEHAESAADAAAPSDDDFYEIEIELDEAPPAEETCTWFDTVSDIFDAVKTEGGKVRFGEGIDEGDAQSQYDLGLAFYEMGLFGEAINALRQAAEDPARRLVCRILQGACLREKGELLLAETALRALLESPGMTPEDACALKYELALTCIPLGKEQESWALFEEIEAINPSYRDVASRLHDASEGRAAGGLDFSEDELLDFDLK